MGEIKYYNHITAVILFSFLLIISVLLTLNVTGISSYIEGLFGYKKAFIIQLYFWSALGATISCSLFLAEDKELNEVESVKEKPDPIILRYPDKIDVFLYIQRIIAGGVLGVIGALLLFSGLFFFEANIQTLSAKHKLFFIIFVFLIGMYQRTFVEYLSGMFRKMLEKQNR